MQILVLVSQFERLFQLSAPLYPIYHICYLSGGDALSRSFVVGLS